MNEMWIVRDEWENLFIYYHKPIMVGGSFEPKPGEAHEYEQLNDDALPFVTFENSPLKLVLDKQIPF